ncbi:S-layer homology domain-containing protein [Paenibacillus eucommiae]|uniref:SLH domain-containing protein n=1 Tax=Paenibacillus eucommiae TaxID=1355755 RepID=A0ABS4INM1_9BACL|nr:S-layer homology domain-containing protein [Paenibacillus eucommiae]MBP1989172.1 hypothetical protein [Paenibacillus eucommiae]
MTFFLFIVTFLPISRAHAEVSLTGFFIQSGKKPYLVGGETIRFSFGDDRAIGTSLEYVRVSYSTDNGLNWIPVPDLKLDEYHGFGVYGIFRLPIDASITSARLRLSTHFAPIIGSDSYPTVDVGPFKIMQPGSASDVTAAANTDGSVTLTWNDNSNMESYYQINRVGGKDGDKTFFVKNTMDHIGPLTYEDKETSNEEDVLYCYTVFPIIDQFPLQDDVKPGAETAIVFIKAKSGILKIKDMLKKSDIIDSIAAKLPTSYIKVDKGSILKTLPDLIDPEKVISPKLKIPGLEGGGGGAAAGTNGDAGGSNAGSNGGSAAGGEAPKEGTPMNDALLEELVKGSSDWAKPELKQAITLLLTTGSVIGSYQQSITREHFAGIAVKLYESLSGTKAEKISPNPFKDTTSDDVLKASNAGIVTGIAADKFAPDATITRQEIAVMLMRAIKSAKPATMLDSSKKSDMADEDMVAPWAIEAVRFASNYKVMNGIGENRIDPLGKTTREQAIVLVKRAYEAFK